MVYLWLSYMKKMWKIFSFYSQSHWRKESDPELNPDPDPLARGTDPDPHQHVTDPQHCLWGSSGSLMMPFKLWLEWFGAKQCEMKSLDWCEVQDRGVLTPRPLICWFKSFRPIRRMTHIEEDNPKIFASKNEDPDLDVFVFIWVAGSGSGSVCRIRYGSGFRSRRSNYIMILNIYQLKHF